MKAILITNKKIKRSSKKGELAEYIQHKNIQDDKTNVFHIIMILSSNQQPQDIPFYYEIFERNNSMRVIQFFKRAFNRGYIVPGDCIIFDNASYHVSNLIQTKLIPWLNRRAINLYSLPYWS